jgi:poly(A) polymerase
MNDRLTPAQSVWLHWPETQRLIAAFDVAGYPLRFVGGAVRDSLLGKPVTDIDAATPAPPQKVMALAENAGLRAIPTGISHGTVTLLIPDAEGGQRSYEITTLRRDIRNFGRHAEVWFTDSWEEDAARRDFTMNALYCDSTGQIYDYFNGITDAQQGIVRFIGEARQRIQEDALRILRFFRFTASYGDGQIDAVGLLACTEEAAKLKQLSGERIGAEMLKLLNASGAAAIISVMQDQGILRQILTATVQTESLAALARIRLMTEDLSLDAILSLALLLRSWPYPEAILGEVARQWRLSGKQATLLKALVEAALIPPEMPEAAQKKLLRAVGSAVFSSIVVISWAEMLGESHSQPQILSAAYRAMLGLPHHWQIPVFPITGNDLLAEGYTADAGLGQQLKKLEEIWEKEGYVPDKQALLRVLRENPAMA